MTDFDPRIAMSTGSRRVFVRRLPDSASLHGGVVEQPDAGVEALAKHVARLSRGQAGPTAQADS